MANEYVIPFGVDGTKFFEGLNAIDKGVDKTSENIDQASKEMQKGFNEAAAAGEKLGNTMKVDAEHATVLREQAKTLGKELGQALSGKGVSGDFEKKLKTFSDMLAKFSANANKPIKFNLDTAKLEEFEKLLASGVDELEVLKGVVEATKQTLATLDPNSEEFAALNTQLQIANGFLEGLGAAAGGAELKQKSLKGQLREMKAALTEMELAGKGGTEEFKALSIQAGELEDQIGDVSQRVKVLASDTKYLDAGVQAVQGLVGAFTAGQGALALFGNENEEVNKVIQKVTGAMAVLQGIQAVANALNKDSALSVLLFSRAQAGAAVTTGALATAEAGQAVAATAATTATNGFTAALLANPVTAIAVAVVALVTALIAFASGSDDAEQATKKLNDALEDQQRILDLDEKSLQRQTNLLIARAKAAGKSESELTRIQGEQLAKQINLRQNAYNETIKLYNDRDLRAKLSAEDNKKLEDELLNFQIQKADDINELEIKTIELQGQRKKETEASQKKATENGKKAIEEEKKRAEERKKILDQELKYTQEFEKAKIDNLKDGYDKERAQANQATNERVAVLQNEKSLSVKAELEKQALIKQIRANLVNDLAEIDKKQSSDLAALQFKAQQIQIENREEGIVKEIETIRLGFEEKKKEIEKEFATEAELRDRLIDSVSAAQEAATKAAQNKFKNENIKNQQEQAILEIETAKQFLPDLAGVEEQKQVAILEVKLKYAQQAMDALIEQGNEENSIVVLQAKKQVQELQKALGVAVKEAAATSQGIDWFKMLGLGDLTEEQRAAVTDAAQKALDSISQITGLIISQYQRQIDKKQEIVDQIDSDIDDLEDQLDKEKDLRDAGLANNVEVIQAELDEKKKAKEDEIKQQEELVEKQKQIAKVQFAIDTAVQASNLITAATKIISGFSSIPIVGVALGIAAVGLMVGGFVASKIKMYQSINSQKQSFGHGGWIDGKPHSQGGKKYQAVDGIGDVVELEGGEHVTKKSQAAKYAGLLEAINNDDLGGMNEDALRAMLGGMGIKLSSEAPKAIIQVVRERDDFKQAAAMNERPGNDISVDVKQIGENVAYMAQKERDRVERWEDEKYYYEKSGSRTTKIKKA